MAIEAKISKSQNGWIVRVAAAVVLSLAFAGTASASTITIPLSQFLIYAGDDLTLSQHTVTNGNVGATGNASIAGGPILPLYPALLNGSAYAGGTISLGQDLTVQQANNLPATVLANGNLTVNGSAQVFGNVIGDDVTLNQLAAIRKVLGIGGNVEFTDVYNPAGNAIVEGVVTDATPGTRTLFNTIALPSATNFSAGGPDQTCNTAGCTQLTLAPGTYGTLLMGATKDLFLSSGNYFFDGWTIGGSLDLFIDLTSGQPINIYTVGGINIGQNAKMWVKGPGMLNYVLISDPSAQALANLIYFETHGLFTLGGSNESVNNVQVPVTWGGTIYSAFFGTLQNNEGKIVLDQYMDFWGHLYAADDFSAGDHSRFNTPPSSVPEPASLFLLGAGLVGLSAYGRRKLKK